MNGHDFDAELRDARAAVLELETRALNAERALEQARDEIASLRAVALGPPDASWQDDRIVDLETQLEAERDRRIEAERERDDAHASLEAEMTRHALLITLLRAKDERLAQHAGCVPLADLRHLLALCETYARHNRDATSEVLDALAFFVVERTAAEKRGRPNWQCSGCGWAFDGAWKKACPCCDREDYWTGSVYPGALRWDGSRGTSVPHRGAEPAEGGETGGG